MGSIASIDGGCVVMTSTNDIFYLAIVFNAMLGLGAQLLLALAIIRFTASPPKKPEQDQ